MSSFTEALENASDYVAAFLQKRDSDIAELTKQRRFAFVKLSRYDIGCFFGIETQCDHHVDASTLITPEGAEHFDLSKAFVISAIIDREFVLLKIVHPLLPTLCQDERLPIIYVTGTSTKGDDA